MGVDRSTENRPRKENDICPRLIREKKKEANIFGFLDDEELEFIWFAHITSKDWKLGQMGSSVLKVFAKIR